MLKTLIEKTKKLSSVFAFVTALAVTAGSSTASADTNVPGSVTGTVTLIDYSSTQFLSLFVGGTQVFGALVAASDCTSNNQAPDTVKAWQSLAQGALLAGKTVKVYFNTCGSSPKNYITALDLNK
jgi:hypothetical protein